MKVLTRPIKVYDRSPYSLSDKIAGVSKIEPLYNEKIPDITYLDSFHVPVSPSKVDVRKYLMFLKEHGFNSEQTKGILEIGDNVEESLSSLDEIKNQNHLLLLPDSYPTLRRNYKINTYKGHLDRNNNIGISITEPTKDKFYLADYDTYVSMSKRYSSKNLIYYKHLILSIYIGTLTSSQYEKQILENHYQELLSHLNRYTLGNYNMVKEEDNQDTYYLIKNKKR